MLFEIPFNSRNKWHLVVTKKRGGADNEFTCFMKGAPEIILGNCSQQMTAHELSPIDENFKRDFGHAYNRFGASGRRVLGFAFLDFTADPTALEASYPKEYGLHLLQSNARVDCGTGGLRL